MNKFLLIGTDSEYFVQNEQGIITSAIDQIGGSKDKPRLVMHGNLQEDNVLAEFAINPVQLKSSWLCSIESVTNTLRVVVEKRGLSLVKKSSHMYDKELLLSFPSAAMELGCEPDYNVYNNLPNEKPSARTRLRTAAGHVHFSYVRPTEEATSLIIKAMDYVLGLWSVIEDSDVARRELYGKAGSCRFKPYGGEYRTLGNFWLENVGAMSYVYDMTVLCTQNPEEIIRRCALVLNQRELVRIIDNCDKPMAALHYNSIVGVINEMQAEAVGTEDVKLSA
jgi:hypothetical protein